MSAANIAIKGAKLVFKIIPPYKAGIIKKLLYSCLLLLLAGIVLFAKLNPGLPYAEAAIAYNPVEYAEELYNKEELVKAYEFINFYQSIPAVPDNARLDELKQKITDERKNIAYIASQIWKGIYGGNPDENYASAVEFVTEFTPIGDVRELGAQALNYKNDKDVDTLATSLASLGIILTAVSLGPQAAFIAPLKDVVVFFKKGVKIMNRKLKGALSKLIVPVVEEFQVLHKTRSSTKILEAVKACAKNFDNIMRVAKTNPKTAMLIVKYSDDIKDMSRNAILAEKMGKDAEKILVFGGKESLAAAEKLETAGKLNGATLKGYMRYGDAGLKAAGKVPLNQLIRTTRLVRIIVSGKLLPYLTRLCNFLSWKIVSIIMALGLLILVKTWTLKAS